jgi:hypothetical protein
MNKNQKLVEPAFLSPQELGERWRCHQITARRRLERHGVMPMKLSERSILYRMSDVTRIERACLT